MLAELTQTRTPTLTGREWPTLVHVTYPKAGSQWVHKILHWLAPERCVTPGPEGIHLTSAPVLPGKIYPTVYLDYDSFQRVALPENTKRFFVTRDLRDMLVSAYFSWRYTHTADDPHVVSARNKLASNSVEDGLLWLIDAPWNSPTHFNHLLASWIKAGEPLVRYEDLLERDEELFEEVLLRRCELPVSREHLLAAVRGCRFEAITRGRSRGQEDRGSHERKGVAGDWRNHFTGRVADAFKACFGQLLVDAGYERDMSW